MLYNTKQKSQIYDCIATKKCDFSIKELHEDLQRRGIKVGLTTIYRFIEQMQENGELKMVDNLDGSIRYQFVGHCDRGGHCYLKCNRCGAIEHIDCEALTSLEHHISSEHKFKMTEENIIINGICEVCS
jgi:Fur family ferric uptake transcriptional regulator